MVVVTVTVVTRSFGRNNGPNQNNERDGGKQCGA